MFRGAKQPCRNFKSGNCHYGDRCKFSHAINIQQQPQQQQQTSTSRNNTNPFGFGGFAQQSKGSPSAFASVSNKQQQNQNQFKVFENKWTRTPDTNSPLFSKQSNQQPQLAAPNHICTSSEGCKRQIEEDFKNERPLWKLTCYGHVKNGPCDIVGDVSYEELRAAAYDDAKKGMSLLSVVERERNMLNSKLMEFENLLRNPYVIPPNTVTDRPSPFPGINTNGSPVSSVQKNVPPVSSFSQLGFSTNQGPNTSTFALPNSNFGQQSPQLSSQTPISFGTSNLNFGAQGHFGNQQHTQPHGNASTFNRPLAFGNNFTASPAASAQPTNVASNKSPVFSIARNAADGLGGQPNAEKSRFQGDPSIWLKEKWEPGEIPEEAPPDEFVR